MSEATTGVPAAKASVRTMPKLSPPSEGATSRSAEASAAAFSVSETLPSTVTPCVPSSMSGSTSSRSAPTTMSSTGTWSRSASKARSSTGSPLRSTAWPTKARRSGAPCGRGADIGSSAGTSTPLGMIR